MNRFSLACVGWVSLIAASRAPAQMPLPGRPNPQVSPYLNLLRPGSRTLNYFGLVRPEQEFRRSIGQMQQDLNATNNALTTGMNAGGEVTTGHASRFMTHYRYFQTNGAGQTGGAGGFGGGGINRPSPMMAGRGGMPGAGAAGGYQPPQRRGR